MRHITEYKLCRGSEGQLEKVVHDALAEGWQPLGTLVVFGDLLVQPMVRWGEGNTDGIEMVPLKPGPAEEAL